MHRKCAVLGGKKNQSSLQTGLWIKNGSEILYSQETHITFWCPMRFGKYPLDKQVRNV